MTLKIQNFKKYLPKIIWGLIFLVISAVLLKTAIWEHNYYQEKQKIIREPLVSSEQPKEELRPVDETEIPQAVVETHQVAPHKPRYFSIPRLGIDKARITEVGVLPNGALDAPISIFDVGWYRKSGTPGTGGTLLMDGHNGGPNKVGVFKYLPQLQLNDIITVERGDGKIFNYKVVENQKVALDHADNEMPKMEKSPVSGKESLSLITCTGAWSNQRRTYLSRQFIRAILE